MADGDREARPISMARTVTLGNFISPLLTILAIGIPALIWGGKIDGRVEYLANDLTRSLTAIRTEMETSRVATTAMSANLVMMNTTISEGLKTTMTELGRRVVNLEAKVDKQGDEITRLQIELATIRRASEPAARPR